jgi:hypothetical protein
LSERLKIKV